MVPFVPASGQEAPLSGTRILISNGRIDPIVSEEETDRLARLMQQHGAEVEVHWQPAGHQLMPSDFAVAKTWLQSIK
jgi:phospholipase/carboxylesterase